MRVDVDRLPPEVVEALDRGDTVEFERDGELVGHARIERKRLSWQEFWQLRRASPPLDEDFLRDVENVRLMLNTPMTDPWES